MVCSVQVVVSRTNEELLRLKSVTLILTRTRLWLHSADLTLRNQRIARDHGADVLTCVKAHQDLSAFCQFFALLPRFGHNPY